MALLPRPVDLRTRCLRIDGDCTGSFDLWNLVNAPEQFILRYIPGLRLEAHTEPGGIVAGQLRARIER